MLILALLFTSTLLNGIPREAEAIPINTPPTGQPRHLPLFGTTTLSEHSTSPVTTAEAAGSMQQAFQQPRGINNEQHPTPNNESSPIGNKKRTKLSLGRRLQAQTAGTPIGNDSNMGQNNQSSGTPTTANASTANTTPPNNSSSNGNTLADFMANFAGLPPLVPKHGGYQPDYKQAANRLDPIPTNSPPTPSMVLPSATIWHSTNVLLATPDKVSSTISSALPSFNFVIGPKNSAQASCEKYDSNDICLMCTSGFVLKNGRCENSPNKVQEICLVSSGYLYDSLGRCARIDSNCDIPTPDGLCSRCFPGFDLLNGVCYQPNAQGCLQAQNGLCQVCASRHSMGEKALCVRYNSNCLTYNAVGNCITCRKSCRLVDGRCQPMVLQSLCLVKKGEQCTRCMPYAAFNERRVCVLIEPNCLNFMENGFCGRCKPGYLLLNKQCVDIRPMLFKSPDNNCAEWGEAMCVGCRLEYWLNNQGRCQSRQRCLLIDGKSGDCTACRDGMQPIQGRCSIGPVTKLLCSQLSPDNSRCLACLASFTLLPSGECVPSS